MTTDTDKLVEMARREAAKVPSNMDDKICLTGDQLAAFRAAIIADLAADVEPVPGAVAYGEVVYSAHTVAALKSRADALAARVAELEKDARRLDAVERNRFELTPLEGGGWDVSQYHSETCDSQLFAVGELTARAAIDSAALAAAPKGTP